MKDFVNYLAKYQSDGVVKNVRQLTKWAGLSKEDTLKELDRLQAAGDLSYTMLDRLPGGPFVYLTHATGYDQAVLLLPDVDIHTEDHAWAAQVFNLIADYADGFTNRQQDVDRYNALIPHYFEYYKASVLFDPAMVDNSDLVDPAVVDSTLEVSEPDQTFDPLQVNLPTGWPDHTEDNTKWVSLENPPNEIKPAWTLAKMELNFCYICQTESYLARRLCPTCTEKLAEFVRYPVAWVIDPVLISNAVYVELIRQYQIKNS